MFRFKLLLVILSLGALYVSTATKPYVYSREADGWLRLYTVPAAWSDAAMRCHLEGGVLASPIDNNLMKEMLSMMAEHHIGRVFTGINCVLPHATFKTIEGYKHDNRTNSCYKLHSDEKTWPRAQATCHKEGGHLAVIDSDIEAVVLKEIFEKITNKPYHLLVGFMKLSGEWQTIHGDWIPVPESSKWSDGEPNNMDEIEYCGSIHINGKFNDAPCNSAYQFICEKNAS